MGVSKSTVQSPNVLKRSDGASKIGRGSSTVDADLAKINQFVTVIEEGDVSAVQDENAQFIHSVDTGRVYRLAETTQGLENNPDVVKLTDGRYAEKVTDGKARRLGTYYTGNYGHLCGAFTYEKKAKNQAILNTDLSKYKAYTESDFDLDGLVIAYVDWRKGNDNTGDGLSWATAKASIYQAVSLGADVVLIRAGIYNRVNRLQDFTVSKDMTIMGVGGRVVSGCLASGTWSKSGGYSNVYQLDYASGLTNSTSAVFDTIILENNAPKKYASAGTIAEVENTPGSFYHSSTTTYVHAADGRDLEQSGDTLRLVQPVATPKITFAGNHKLYLKNYENWGGSSSNCLTLVGNGTEYRYSTFYNQNCIFAGSIDGGTGNGLAVRDIGLCISENSQCLVNRRDGFNYHGWLEGASGVSGMSPHFVEIDCRAHGNGAGGTENNNQGSTAHEAVVGFRINGDYSYHTDGGCIVDIDASKVWHVGITANYSSRVGMLLSSDGFESDFGEWWIDGARCVGNPEIGNARGDIACDGYQSRLHFVDADTEKHVSTRTFSPVVDDDLSV